MNVFFRNCELVSAGERNSDLFVGYLIADIIAMGGGTFRDLPLNVDLPCM
ncbi:MAG: hypothetical protein P8O07_02850 [Crocinitomicaceae bacterium]|nr:hypothetical protein [Crocinitomicaceae bacterium]